ncbi:hypothetical protein BST63_06490 [Bradyrhizobium canariense]|uniref:Uncharacterized protein n=1 Tax=Bradyrhizobium canariense TaxID=255045 RepID=A0ABX3X8I0_9BRAD|nr:hypothetical protein BSR47_26085 [Bradyrhizobium canariense]OSJ33048.1 hypothetical protein BST63_06490 [Bradyrhizobium canariense]
MAPIQKVMLTFATNQVNTGTVIDKAYSQSILIDLPYTQTECRIRHKQRLGVGKLQLGPVETTDEILTRAAASRHRMDFACLSAVLSTAANEKMLGPCSNLRDSITHRECIIR